MIRFDAPENLWSDISEQLRAGVASSKHAMHLMTVATAKPDGHADARIVVVREFDPEVRRLSFHADIRSPKIAHLSHDPEVVLVLWDAGTKLQLRIAARTTVHSDDDRSLAGWLKTAPPSRLGYAQPHAPGEAIPNDDWVQPAEVSLDDAEARGRFAWIDCEMTTIDALLLEPTGNRRAVLSWDGAWKMQRIGA